MPDARAIRAAGLAAMAVVFAGCPKVPTQTAAMAAAPNVTISAQQLQQQNYETGRRFTSIITLAADSIERRADTKEVRARALQWEVSAVPLVQEAALRIEPLVATVDLAVLAVQQRAYFTTGDGKDAFGALQPIAVNASKAMEDDIFTLMDRGVKSGEIKPGARAALVNWATDHPIRGSGMERESILGANWEAIGSTQTSLVGTAASMDRTLQLLTLRLGYMNETLAQQARWNARLAFDEALARPGGDSLYRGAQTALAQVGGFAADFPSLLDRQRSLLMAGVDKERVAALADVDRQRVESFRELDRQRTALQAALDQQRAALMADVDRERVAVMRSADSLAASTIARSESALRRLAWEILLGASVAAGLLAVLLVRLLRGRAVSGL